MKKFFALFCLIFLFSAATVSAANTGGIDSTNAYAYGENMGWLNLGTSQGNVQVTNSGLTGYVWTENTGWVSLNCSNTSSCGSVNYGVANDGSGNLSGYAWGENIGWISFSCSNTSSCGSVSYGVTIDQTSGDFSGYAYGENAGWISFNCSNTSSCGTVSYKTSIAAAAQSTSSNPSYAGGQLSYNNPAINQAPLPPPGPMFPPGRPANFTPPSSAQASQIVQPGKQQEAVPKFVIPAAIGQKLNLIWQLVVSTVKQGTNDALSGVHMLWNGILYLLDLLKNPSSGVKVIVPQNTLKNTGGLVLPIAASLPALPPLPALQAPVSKSSGYSFNPDFVSLPNLINMLQTNWR